MLRDICSPELGTGVIAASGTVGQIIPPSIVIAMPGRVAGDTDSAVQESRAQLADRADALTCPGQPAVVPVGTLLKSALLPGICLAVRYGAHAFGGAPVNPSRAPAVCWRAATPRP